MSDSKGKAGQADDTAEIEVTPQMIEAGIAAWEACEHWSKEVLVTGVFRAMLAARSDPVKDGGKAKGKAGQADADADATKIRFTAEMIEAGTKVLWESGRIPIPANGPDQELVRHLLEVCLWRARRNGRIA